MDDVIKTLRTLALLGMMTVGLLSMAGCATNSDLTEQVRKICGEPAKDLRNVDAYSTCVYTVLDIAAEQRMAENPDATYYARGDDQ